MILWKKEFGHTGDSADRERLNANKFGKLHASDLSDKNISWHGTSTYNI